MRPTQSGKVTLIELGLLAIYICLITFSLQWGYHRYGGWYGAVKGLIAVQVVLLLVGVPFGLLASLIYTGMSYPPCRTGKCRSSDYRLRGMENEPYALFCGCGMPYRHRGRRFYEVQPDGSLRPYMVWRAFKGWFPDG